MKNKKILIVGAGFTGSVIARELASNGCIVDVIDERTHIGGNCYTERDSATSILVHKYGPHIFHTNDLRIWNYVNEYTTFMPFVNRVKTTTGGQVYSLPINLHTINQFYKKNLNPTEAKKHIQSLADGSIDKPVSFEEQALKFVGKDLYEAFFKDYTIKQWGIHPNALPASILKRLPVRFNYDDNYFEHKYQGMPLNGYTEIFEKILKHVNITVCLNRKFNPLEMSSYDHTIYTGAIDRFYEFRLGRLNYRTLDFVTEYHEGDYQGCAVMNYPSGKIDWTRISEHKHFAPWETHEKTIIFKEYSRDQMPDDIPYYPIRQVEEKRVLKDYVQLAERDERSVSFAGRLGTYRYLDMDVTIREALEFSEILLTELKISKPIQKFSVHPFK